MRYLLHVQALIAHRSPRLGEDDVEHGVHCVWRSTRSGTLLSPGLWVVSSREPLFGESVFLFENRLHVRVRIAQPLGERPEALAQAFLPQPANRVVDRALGSARLARLFSGDRELVQQASLVGAE